MTFTSDHELSLPATLSRLPSASPSGGSWQTGAAWRFPSGRARPRAVQQPVLCRAGDSSCSGRGSFGWAGLSHYGCCLVHSQHSCSSASSHVLVSSSLPFQPPSLRPSSLPQTRLKLYCYPRPLRTGFPLLSLYMKNLRECLESRSLMNLPGQWIALGCGLEMESFYCCLLH